MKVWLINWTTYRSSDSFMFRDTYCMFCICWVVETKVHKYDMIPFKKDCIGFSWIMLLALDLIGSIKVYYGTTCSQSSFEWILYVKVRCTKSNGISFYNINQLKRKKMYPKMLEYNWFVKRKTKKRFLLTKLLSDFFVISIPHSEKECGTKQIPIPSS